MEKSGEYKIKRVAITNFKSVKSVTLSDCRRINVLIGRPNVGKSNILEALALFDVPYLVNSSNKSLKNLVRIENTAELFHNGITAQPIEVNAGADSLVVTRNANNGLTIDISTQGELDKYTFSPSLKLTSKKDTKAFPDILVYFFPKQFVNEPSNVGYLVPPSGNNLM